MSVKKRGKLPFDVSKGRAQDMYRLKFIRKSELEPTTRHKMRHTASEVCRQLDQWKKEQKVRMNKLNKRQYQMYETGRRLKREQRRLKVTAYTKQQEEVRRQLKDVRERELMLEVLQKFKENAYMSKGERREEMERLTREALLQDRVPEPEPEAEDSDHCDDATETEPVAIQQYAMSGKVPMATIEEEWEVEDRTPDPPYSQLPSPGRGNLDRSTSQRDIFAAKERVHLLPELSRSNISSVNIVGSAERDDKGTQTPAADETDGLEENVRDHRKVKKNFILKLPRSRRPVPKTERSPSATGIFGSDSDYEADDDKSDEDTFSDIDLPEGEYWESYSDYTDQSSSSSEFHPDKLRFPISKLNIRQRQFCPNEYASVAEGYDFVPKDHHGGLPKDFSSISKEYGFIPKDYDALQNEQGLTRKGNERYREKEFDLTPYQFPKQNPYSLQFKERSFFLKQRSDNQRTGSGGNRPHPPEDGHHQQRDVNRPHTEQFLDIRDKMTRQYSLMKEDSDARHMSIYGKKAGYNNKKYASAPPNTPLITVSTPQSKLLSRSHLSVMLLNQKRAQDKDKKRSNQTFDIDPIVKQERSRSHLPTTSTPRGRPSMIGASRHAGYDVIPIRNRYEREKLLRSEQNRILGQNVRVKKFMDSIEPHEQEYTIPGKNMVVSASRPCPMVHRMELIPTTPSPSSPNRHSVTSSLDSSNRIYRKLTPRK